MGRFHAHEVATIFVDFMHIRSLPYEKISCI